MRLAAHVQFGLVPERRKRDRQSTALETSLHGAGTVRIPVKVVDLSSDGCRLEFRGDVPEGAAVTIALPGLDAWEASVIWSKRGTAGCRFTRPLHPSLVQRFTESADDELTPEG